MTAVACESRLIKHVGASFAKTSCRRFYYHLRKVLVATTVYPAEATVTAKDLCYVHHWYIQFLRLECLQQKTPVSGNAVPLSAPVMVTVPTST